MYALGQILPQQTHACGHVCTSTWESLHSALEMNKTQLWPQNCDTVHNRMNKTAFRAVGLLALHRKTSDVLHKTRSLPFLQTSLLQHSCPDHSLFFNMYMPMLHMLQNPCWFWAVPLPGYFWRVPLHFLLISWQIFQHLGVRHAACACTKHVAFCICLHIIFQETLFHTTPAWWVAVVRTYWEITPCENNTFATLKCPQTDFSSPGHQPAVNSHLDFSHLQATVVQHTVKQYEGLRKREEVKN